MELDGHTSQLSAGNTVHIPRGVVHAGANVGTETGRRLVMFSPAGLERFFEEVGLPAPGKFDRTAARNSAVRHGWDFLPTET